MSEGTMTPMRAANQEVKRAFASVARALYVWCITVYENSYQKHLDNWAFKHQPDLKRLAQLMQKDGEMRIIVEIYASRLTETNEPVYLEPEHKMQVLAFCQKNGIKPPSRVFAHPWERIKLTLNDEWMHEDGKFSVQVGNLKVLLWQRRYWGEHVEFRTALRDVFIKDVPGEDPDIHQLLEHFKAVEAEAEAEAKAAQEAATAEDNATTTHKPETKQD